MALANATLLKTISEDHALASAILFPHRHSQASPRCHVEIMDLWRSQDEFVEIEMFREGAKSTLDAATSVVEYSFIADQMQGTAARLDRYFRTAATADRWTVRILALVMAYRSRRHWQKAGRKLPELSQTSHAEA